MIIPLNCLNSRLFLPFKSFFNISPLRPVFSSSLTHYVLDCLGPSFPATFLASLAPTVAQDANATNANATRHVVRTLDPQSDLAQALASMALPKVVKLDIPVRDGRGERVLKAKVYLPTSLRAANQIKYPLLLHV